MTPYIQTSILFQLRSIFNLLFANQTRFKQLHIRMQRKSGNDLWIMLFFISFWNKVFSFWNKVCPFAFPSLCYVAENLWHISVKDENNFVENTRNKWQKLLIQDNICIKRIPGIKVPQAHNKLLKWRIHEAVHVKHII